MDIGSYKTYIFISLIGGLIGLILIYVIVQRDVYEAAPTQNTSIITINEFSYPPSSIVETEFNYMYIERGFVNMLYSGYDFDRTYASLDCKWWYLLSKGHSPETIYLEQDYIYSKSVYEDGLTPVVLGVLEDVVPEEGSLYEQVMTDAESFEISKNPGIYSEKPKLVEKMSADSKESEKICNPQDFTSEHINLYFSFSE